MSYYEIPADKDNYLNVKLFKNLTSLAHFHNAVELVFVLKGKTDVFINGEKYSLNEGDACISDSFDMHYYKMQEASEYLIVVASRDYLAEFKSYTHNLSIENKFSVNKEVLDLVNAWRDTYKTENKLMRTAKLLYLLSFIKVSNNTSGAQKKKSLFINEIFQYIHENYKSKITVEFLAEKFGYSRGYVSTMFSAYTGENFNSYINRLRVINAKAELEKGDGRKVLDIALENGFDSANTFYRAYKKQFGEPPLRSGDEKMHVLIK